MKFAYEKLEVWNKAIEFSVKVIDAVEDIRTNRKNYPILKQIEASSINVPIKIFERKRYY